MTSLSDMITITPTDNETDEWRYNQEYLLGLLDTTGYEGRYRREMESAIMNKEEMNEEIYNKILHNLLSNQLDRITSGMNYSASDIKRHLRKLR